MTTNQGDMPAFPIDELSQHEMGNVCSQYFGLTKREIFAGLAMQSIIRNRGMHYHDTEQQCLECKAKLAKSAVDCADAVLAALEVRG